MEVEEEEEDDQKNPGNLLDNLFKKTKTTPCLYWLPLTDEQVRKATTPYPLPPQHQLPVPLPSLNLISCALLTSLVFLSSAFSSISRVLQTEAR